MAWYLDTSAFLKLVVSESRSAAMTKWARGHADDLCSSDLLRTEALRVARRHSPEALTRARAALDTIVILRLTADLFDHAADLDPGILRTLDALHLAAALSLGDELDAVVTYDLPLTEAAALHGVSVLTP